MPLYTWTCRCGSEVEDLRTIANRNVPENCPTCGRRMKRDMAYRINTATNEASTWPQKMDALVPEDPKLERAYRRKGYLVDDGYGGETVKVDSEAHYKAMCREQNLVPTARGQDYERPSRSRGGVGRKFPKPKVRFKGEAKETVRKKLIADGVRGYGVT